jgi:hypothetical protein
MSARDNPPAPSPPLDTSLHVPHTEYMSPDEIRQQIEFKVVEMLKDAIGKGTLTEDRAQTISQHVLSTLQPGMSLEELYRAIPKLDDSFPELSPLILPILREYEENVNKKAMKSVGELIRQGQYDAAEKLGKRAVSQEIKLEWQGSAKASPQR